MGGYRYPTTYNTDVLKALVENQLEHYWDDPPMYLSKNEWKKMLEQSIYSKAYMEDMELLSKNESKAQFVEIIKEYNQNMSPYKPLIKELEMEIEKIKEVLKVMMGSTKFNWKKKGNNNEEIRSGKVLRRSTKQQTALRTIAQKRIILILRTIEQEYCLYNIHNQKRNEWWFEVEDIK
ncbi:hypothetical protein RFI_28361 [Reticulomyxa filosa]|uniref:Uncharacterized protein n=1 Tax=Reticulomyxa filosa TaxID=46433 RepID=X6M4W8_RETFI|nr:hypothetical protein RFI_28361 [Reticulomyxa filosa]|eukprot:ETO09028.1 hypothetical protein RFI_28361 [Reticulomyxa filosa]